MTQHHSLPPPRWTSSIFTTGGEKEGARIAASKPQNQAAFMKTRNLWPPHAGRCDWIHGPGR